MEIKLQEHLVELIRRTSTELPSDVKKALNAAYKQEETGTAAKETLSYIIKNVELARANSTPICQDTGTLLFSVCLPSDCSTLEITGQIQRTRLSALLKTAVAEATELGFLRPNAVDAVTDKNSGNNIGVGFPIIEFHEHEDDSIRIDLMLKGGGSENVSTQYSLPYAELQADRSLNGVRKVVLHAIQKAQGLGCPPGIIGVGIGGDRYTSYRLAKKQLFRKIDAQNPIPELDKLERKLFEQSNALGIGPMGFGGRTTTLGVKIGAMHRLPACYFVSIAYMCWAARRHTLCYRNGEIDYD